MERRRRENERTATGKVGRVQVGVLRAKRVDSMPLRRCWDKGTSDGRSFAASNGMGGGCKKIPPEARGYVRSRDRQANSTGGGMEAKRKRE